MEAVINSEQVVVNVEGPSVEYGIWLQQGRTLQHMTVGPGIKPPPSSREKNIYINQSVNQINIVSLSFFDKLFVKYLILLKG